MMSLNTMGLDMVLYRVDSTSFIFGLAFLNRRITWRDLWVANGKPYGRLRGVDLLRRGGLRCLCRRFDELVRILGTNSDRVCFPDPENGVRARPMARPCDISVCRYSQAWLLLMGAVKLFAATGDLSLRQLTLGADAGTWFLFLAFGIKAAFPFLHNWLQDAYPKATIVGTVVLSGLYNKARRLRAYARVSGRKFADLYWCRDDRVPVFFAVLENDLRKVLAYSLNNQVGFMVCAIGVGTTSRSMARPRMPLRTSCISRCCL